MSTRDTQERIARLQASAHAQRLAAQLAIIEARDELAPLRSAAGLIRTVVRVFSPAGTAGGMIGTAARLGISHPWLGPAVAAAALRLLRRRPLAFLLAAAAGVTAWWLFRPSRSPGNAQGPPA